MSDDNGGYWRSLEERAGAKPDSKEFQASIFEGMLRRRDFLGLMAASAAMAGLAACRKPVERILPYDAEPEEVVPGKPLLFATTLTRGGYGRGALVRSDEGRPTKVEGNPLHPDSLGACESWMLASVLDLYDPDRSRLALESGRPSSWGAARRALEAAMDGVRKGGGAGLRILTGASTSPTLAAQLASLRRGLPEARWHAHEPAAGAEHEGTRLAFGAPLKPRYDLAAADALVCFDADPLFMEPGSLAYARAFGDRRDPDAGRPLRLYAAEAQLSVTGANADHRLAVRPSRLPAVLAAAATALGVRVEGPALSPEEKRWVDAAAADLKAAGPKALVLVGPRQPPALQALGHALNHTLGAAGRTVSYSRPVEVSPLDAAGSFSELCADLAAGRVAALLVLGVNPAYSAPEALGFAQALERAPFSLHLGLHRDETAEACRWHVPMAHELESWGDARAFDGTASIRQPLIAPMYGGLAAEELLGAAAGRSASAHDAVRACWKARGLKGARWDRAVHDGVIAGTRAPAGARALAASWRPPRVEAARETLELVLRPSPAVYDGKQANNGWLQELPQPFTTVTWGDAALVSPDLAARLGVRNGDELELKAGGASVQTPAWIVPGQADGTVVLSLGYGRRRGGRVAEGVGVSAYLLRPSESAWSAPGLAAVPTGRSRKMPATQGRQDMEGRDLVRVASYDEYEARPRFAQKPDELAQQTLLTPKPPQSAEHAWGMTIDLSRCIGCSVCVIACQAENNVPVVGPEEVSRGRHMHWIRVDAYYKGTPRQPEGVAFQPVPCMHCEDAPCEEVCPVGATVHSDEGLNEMVYNRCVGTRYCSNNCPYKVRRFNFFRFSSQDPTRALANNPDVTVRERGVMEKCTYCVQRIQGARLDAEKEGRAIADGEIVPACAAACPSRAIVFGDLKDRKSAVSKEKAKPRNYGILTELGTRPRTTYLARVTNPKPGGPK
jgi:molybdopterin-containing oxidoreductase family iron-sulfur binding subunit